MSKTGSERFARREVRGYRHRMLTMAPSRRMIATLSQAVESLEPRLLLATYYVDPGGTDSSAGSSGAPWKTLQKAANAVVAGDTVVVRPGNYAGFNLAKSGSESARITFSAQSGAVIDAPVTIGNR